jgi:hypothetical protein
MNKERILQGFDDYAGAKKSSATTVRLILLFAAVINIITLLFCFGFASKVIGRIIVVDRNTGEVLKVTPDYADKLFNTQLATHCSNAVYYANSFDRLKITENQARAVFIISKPDAYRIFARYKEQRAYGDALDRGLVYKAQFLKMEDLQGTQEPYRVRFTSLLQVFDNDVPIREFIITSEGEVRRQTPQYPENTTGFYFSKYTQTWAAKKLSNE